MNLTFTLHGRPVTLVSSCLSGEHTGSGLLLFRGNTWLSIDDLSTASLFVSNQELTRILQGPGQVASGTCILQYINDTLARTICAEDLSDPQKILWDGHRFVAVSSHRNAVVWVNPRGSADKCFQAVTEADAWHLNGLLLRNGLQRESTGILYRSDKGEDVLTILCCPHTPRLESGEWIVCNSVSSELCVFTAGGELLRRVQLRNRVRGVAITDHYLLAGESVNGQLTHQFSGATVAVVDRQTWKVIGRLNLPYREIHDLVLASPSLMNGILRADCPTQIPVARSA
jgi:hypothetical protein